MTNAERKLMDIAESLGIDTQKYKGNALCKQIRLAHKAIAAESAKDILEIKPVKSAKDTAKRYVAEAAEAYGKAKAAYEEALWEKRLAYEELQGAKAVRTAVNKQAPVFREKEKAEKAKAKAEKAKQNAAKAKAKQSAYIEALRKKLDKAIADSKVA